MAFSLIASQTLILRKPTVISPNNLTAAYPLRLSFSLANPKRPAIIAKSSGYQNPALSLLTSSTRTVTTLLALALTASKVLNLGLQLKGFHGLPEPLVHSAGPVFFAPIGDASTGTLNTVHRGCSRDGKMAGYIQRGFGG
ncbi:ylmG homolog protein 1-1, chloroplastic-like [Coffea eugenioides]|uniref:ylmG homolog protein 1-1, chloroplastic-like n=1 Tax=Coffea eugenioides TaxID=49369 RepID=UPI000F60CE6E|nr:ylmG homolog protein 1-1, chloroplastic-like [Coffea eugenioides]